MSDQSEEKSSPASAKKLRDARRKGQVSHSRDLVGGVTLTLVFGYLVYAAPKVSDRLAGMVSIVSDAAAGPFEEVKGRVIYTAFEILLLTSVPLVAVIVVGVFLSGMASTFGPVFSFDPLIPKFDHINPAKGLERIFSVRSVVEFGKAALKVAILSAAFFMILRGAIEPLFETPICGFSCALAAAVETVKPLAVTAAVAFIVIGLVDLLVQRQLFLRDMRMTHTETKREHKDLEGDPHIRSERNRQRRAAGQGSRLGIQHAVIAIMHGDVVVGLRYSAKETPVPLVVSKATGEAAAEMLAAARERGLAIVDNEELASALAKRHRPGDTIQPDLFRATALVLVKAGFG